MTDCNNCGCCCDVISLPQTASMLSMLAPDLKVREWAAQLQVVSKDEAKMLAPWMFKRQTFASFSVQGQTMTSDEEHFYVCGWFDRETRTCLEYERRPDVCSGFPWYGQKPTGKECLPPECSFRADIGQRVVIRSAR